MTRLLFYFAMLMLAAGCSQGSRADPAVSAIATDSSDALPPDLRTRNTGSDWPGFLGPNGDGKSSETGILTNWPPTGPRIVWTLELGSGYGMPAVSRGRLFQFDRVDDRARLRAVNSETGKPLWQFDYPTDYVDFYGFDNGPRTSPIVDENRVYIVGPEGMLHCIRADDGQIVWKVDTTVQFGVVQNFFGVGSTPAIEGELLIAQVGGSPPDSPDVRSGRVRGNGSGIVAFDKRTGEVRYQITDELASYAGPMFATIAGRRWCFVFARGGLVGFNPSNGQVDFQYPWRAKVIESVNVSNPVIVDDRVFISEAYDLQRGSSLLRVKPGGYEVLWTDKSVRGALARGDLRAPVSMQTHMCTPIHHEGYLYGSSGRHSPDAELRCVELSTGKVIWSEPDLGWTQLLYVDNHFIAISEDGTLRLLVATAEKFSKLAEIVLVDPAGSQSPLGGVAPLLKPPAWAASVLAHGLIYVRGADRLVCLELIPR